MRRREFVALLGGAAPAWPLAARAQQQAMPVVAFVNTGTADAGAGGVAALRKGLGETGYIEGQNVTVEYHWLAGQFERLPRLMADLVRRRVAVIAAPGSATVALAAKAATATIPIIFGVGDDPVKNGLVASFSRPGGNATGVNFFTQEVVGKRLGLLHELVPKAVRIAVLVNPANVSVEAAITQLEETARALGLQIQLFKAGTIGEIDAAFAAFASQRSDALFVTGDSFLASRRVQFAILASRDRLPASYVVREVVEAGGLMSYGASVTDMYRQVGIYTGSILKGVATPADLPVVQSTKFEFVINLGTARALGIDVPPTLLAIADEVIE